MPLKHRYELCDDAFSQGTFIREFRVEIQRKATCPTVCPTPAPKQPSKKTWRPAQSHQMTTVEHHLPKEVDLQCILSAATGIAP